MCAVECSYGNEHYISRLLFYLIKDDAFFTVNAHHRVGDGLPWRAEGKYCPSVQAIDIDRDSSRFANNSSNTFGKSPNRYIGLAIAQVPRNDVNRP
jgi:hypothetical protein